MIVASVWQITAARGQNLSRIALVRVLIQQGDGYTDDAARPGPDHPQEAKAAFGVGLGDAEIVCWRNVSIAPPSLAMEKN